MKQSLYTHVPSEGPRNARIVIICEAPWINEVEAGRPLAGASGNVLKRWWGPIGLRRHEMRLMNLFPYRPPTRDIESVPAAKLIKAIEGIHERIAKLEDPVVLVPCGNYATYALTGKGKVRAEVSRAFNGNGSATEAEKKAGITSLRGSIYPYRDLNGRVLKVIPTIHPAGVLQMAGWEKRTIRDWERVAYEAQFREIREPRRRHIINPTESDILQFYSNPAVHDARGRMSIDIETWGNYLSCVGFAASPYESITIPCHGKDAWTLPWIKALCESACQKVLCNGSYDWYWLDAAGIDIVNYVWDVQSMHHAIDPAETHALHFLASIYCPHYVYWKDEAKEAEEIVKYARDLDSLYVYNGLDCCYTRELVDILEAELIREGMLDFYFAHYAAMFEPLLRTMRHGIRVDVEAQKKEAKRLKGEMEEAHQALNAIAGFEVFATSEVSKLREPTKDEWFKLLDTEATQDREDDEIELPPKPKFINKEARARLNYIMSGKNAGKIRYKVTKAKKDFSKDALFKLFHEKLGLPKQFVMRKLKTGKKRTQSLNEAAIRKLMYRYKAAEEPGRLILEFREKKKERDYLRGAYDKDGRVRCSYKMNTRAGRLSSSKNPTRTGANLQNLKR